MNEPQPVPTRPLARSSLVADRAVAIMVIGTLVVLFAMAGMVAYLVLRVNGEANANQATAATAHASTLTACNLANANRTEDVHIFSAILALPAIAKPQFITPDMRAVQQAALDKVDAEIKAAYALRDCAALYGPG
jgi:hypothetical protein